MWRPVVIGEHFSVRVDIVGEHELLFILSDVRVVHNLGGVAGATEGARVLLDLKLDLILRALILLILHVELPQLILVAGVRSLVLGSWHFPMLQVVLTVFGSTVLVCELNHSISIRPRRDWHVGPIQIGLRLVNLLSCIDVSGELATKLLAGRRLAAVLLVVELLVGD